MKRVIVLVLGLVLVGNVFALDLGKVEQVWDKSMDIAITELDNLDFDIPRAEDVEAKVNNEMYVSGLESKVKQLEAEVSLLKKEKNESKLLDMRIEYQDLLYELSTIDPLENFLGEESLKLIESEEFCNEVWSVLEDHIDYNYLMD